MKPLLIISIIAAISYYAGYYKACKDRHIPVFASEVTTHSTTPAPRDRNWIYYPHHSPLDEPAKRVGGNK